jgi:hypothetical protein
VKVLPDLDLVYPLVEGAYSLPKEFQEELVEPRLVLEVVAEQLEVVQIVLEDEVLADTLF